MTWMTLLQTRNKLSSSPWGRPSDLYELPELQGVKILVFNIMSNNIVGVADYNVSLDPGTVHAHRKCTTTYFVSS